MRQQCWLGHGGGGCDALQKNCVGGRNGQGEWTGAGGWVGGGHCWRVPCLVFTRIAVLFIYCFASFFIFSLTYSLIVIVNVSVWFNHLFDLFNNLDSHFLNVICRDTSCTVINLIKNIYMYTS